MRKFQTEAQIRSEALARIEEVLTTMSVRLDSAQKIEPRDPVLRQRQWAMKRALNRIEFEMLVALGGAAEDPDATLLAAELETDVKLAKVIYLRPSSVTAMATMQNQINDTQKENL
jgi:hypothetical protein